MKRLYAGPFCGELGWELFCWQGYLRKVSKKYDEAFVACRQGNEALYADFATKVFPQFIECEECDMWDCKGYKTPGFAQIFDRAQGGNRWIEPKKPVLRYDHQHKLDKEPLFAKFKEQEFVKLGEKSEPRYDIVIHARAKNNKVNAGMDSQYRNWAPSEWEQLVNLLRTSRLLDLRDVKIAWIGTKKGAHYIDSAGDDLRGIPLAELANVLANSKMIVGPSSGPIHLAALCGCPQITWYGEPYDVKNHARFEKDWNPFNTPVKVMRYEKWNPAVNTIADEIKRLVG